MLHNRTSGKWVRMCLYGIKYGYKIILEIKDSQEKSYLSGQTGRRKRQDRNTIRERSAREHSGKIVTMCQQKYGVCREKILLWEQRLLLSI